MREKNRTGADAAVRAFEKSDISQILLTIGGMLIYAIGINNFIVPAGLYSGGIIGISQILRTLLVQYAHLNFGGTDIAGIISLILNLPLFVLAYMSVGRHFFWKTVICVVSQSLFLTLIPIPVSPIVEDTITATLIGGIIVGAGIGISLQSGGCSGGIDILGMYFTKKYNGFSVGKLNLLINLVIYGNCALLFDIKVVIYCIIYAAVNTLMVDKTHTQNIRTAVIIITKEDPEKIKHYIMDELARGVTHWNATAGYTDDRSHILFTVMSKHELSMLKQEMKYIDPKAFIVSKDNVGIDGRFAKHL